MKKSLSKKIWDFLGSRDLSVFIFIMSLTYVLFLAIFGIMVPVVWVNNLARLLPFKVLYILFFINLIICEIKWVPAIISRCKRPVPPETATDLLRFRHRVDSSSKQLEISVLEKYLRRRGYRVKSGVSAQDAESCDGIYFMPHVSTLLYAYKGRFSSVGNLLSHAAFLFLLVGVFVSLLFRFEGRAIVTEGFPFSGSASEYSAISASPYASIPDVSFDLNKITPRFWQGELLFTELRADMTYKDGPKSAWLSSPAKIGGANIIISSISRTPMYVLKDKNGREIDAAYVNLAIFVPGSEDHFQIPGFPHQIFVSFYPDYELRGGSIISRSMEERNPAYFVKIFRGRLLVYSGLIKPGEEATFEGLKISFPEMRYWGEFRIIKDPGLLLIWSAFILLVAGLVWRLIFYKREILLLKEVDGIGIYGSSDYYHRLFENRLMMLAEIKFER